MQAKLHFLGGRMKEEKSRVIIFLMAMFLLLITAPALMAQSQFISGTVVDQTGAVVAGAKVSITDSAKGTLAREVSTDEQGRFMALNLQPGNYTIAVEMTGFKKGQISIQLEVNTKLDVGQIKMELGEISAEVAVTAVIPTVQTNTMEKSFLVESKQIQELPMNGRNWVALMKTVPGVVSMTNNDFDTNFNDVSGFHAAGGRGSQNNFYLDGSPNLDVGDNQSQYTQPSIESISEFKVQQSSFNAEYGRNSGMVVAVQTKSGGSNFHGTAYEFLRNDALQSHDFGQPNKSTLRYNLFGGNISGWAPIPKISTKSNKKVFFFYNREMTRRTITPSGQRFADIPGAALLSGDYSGVLNPGTPYSAWNNDPMGTIYQPGTVTRDAAGHITGGQAFPNNQIPSSLFYAPSANLLKIFSNIPGYTGLPASPGIAGAVRWYFINPDKLRKDQDLLRVDYNLSTRTTTYFRWVNDYQLNQVVGSIWGGNSWPVANQERPKPGSSWSWNIVNTLSPTLASETILSYNHQSQKLAATGTLADRDAQGVTFTQLYPFTNVANYLPDFNVTGNNNTPGVNMTWGNPGWHNDGKDYALTENLSWVKASHTFKFGFYYNRDNKKQTGTWPQQGALNFLSTAQNPFDTGTNLANLQLGILNSYNMSNASIYPYFRFQSWEGFAQDSWKITNRLTFEYGARFQRTTPTYTYTRPGEMGEGTYKLYMPDLSKFNGTMQYNSATGKVVGDLLQNYLANGLVCDPCDGVDRGFAKTRNFVSPRIGFAYDVFGNGKMALRAGFGQYVERLRQNNFNFGAGAQFPNGGGVTLSAPLYNKVADLVAGPPPSTTFPDRTPAGYTIFPIENTMPTIYSWNLGIQNEVAHNFTLDLAYVGNRGNHLMLQRSINGTPAGTSATPAYAAANRQMDALRPYLGYGALTSIETSAYSSYNAMQARLGRRFANRFSFNVNYTWSKTMDLVDNDSDGNGAGGSGTLINPRNARLNWAPASYDATHTLSVDYIYQLPGVKGHKAISTLLSDWQISGIVHYQSAFPITIVSNGDMQCTECGFQTVNLIPNRYPYGRTSLDPTAFTRPQDGQYGSLDRNALRGVGFGNWDVTFSRNIRIKEGLNLKIAADVFNIFNHAEVWSLNNTWASDTQGGGPNTSTLSNFGNTSAFRPPRTMQMGFKFTF